MKKTKFSQTIKFSFMRVILKNKFRFMLVFISFQAVVFGADKVNKSYNAEIEKHLSSGRYKEAESIAKEKLVSNSKNNSTTTVNEQLFYTTVLGMAEFRQMKLDSSMLRSRMALKLCLEATDSLLIVDAWKLTAYSLNYKGKLDSALLYSNKILAYGKRKGDLKRTGDALASIATIFAQKKNHKYALKLYKEYEQINIKRGDSLAIPLVNYNIGLMYLSLNEYDSCIARFKNAIKWGTLYNKKDLLVLIYGNLSGCYLKMNNIPLWQTNINEAIRLANEIQNHQYAAMGYMDLMTYELKNKNLTNALKYGKKAATSLTNHPYLILQMKLDSLMYATYKEAGDNKNAIVYLESFTKKRNEFEDENSKSILSEFMAKYNHLNDEMLIAQQKIELNKKNKTLYWLFSVLIITVLILISYSIWIVRLKKLRHQLFLKEKTMELQMEENKEWLDWKLNKNTTLKNNPELSTNKIPTNQSESQIHTNLLLELRELFESKKLYRNPNLDVESVIKELGTNKKYLYYAINSNSENFRSFLNRYRIEEAKELIRNSTKNKTSPNFTDIYENSGFNSNVTFYRAFKSVTGLTPKEYALECALELENSQK